jgi:hypothetical protein
LRLDVGGALDSGGAGNILAWAAAASAAAASKKWRGIVGGSSCEHSPISFDDVMTRRDAVIATSRRKLSAGANVLGRWGGG